MKKYLIFLLTTMFFIANIFGQSKNLKFKIEGKVAGFPENSKLYLCDLTKGMYSLIDSVITIKGEFIFSRTLKSKALKVGITTADYEDRVNFWVENTTVSFQAEKGNFRNAKISGSKLQDEQMKFYAVFDAANNKQSLEYFYIKKNPNSVIAAISLYNNRSSWSRDTVSNLYKSLSKEIKETYYGKNILDFIVLSKHIKIGDSFINFTQKDTLGKTVKLSDFKGKVILLEFWGSWCAGCRENNEAFIKIYEEFNSKGFVIFGVAAETKMEDLTKAIQLGKLPWINVTDLKGDKNIASIIYGVNAYPTNYLIDRSGKIIATELYGDDLRNELLKLF